MEVVQQQNHTAFEKFQKEKHRADTLDNHKKTLNIKMDTISDKEVNTQVLHPCLLKIKQYFIFRSIY